MRKSEKYNYVTQHNYTIVLDLNMIYLYINI